MSRSRRRGDQGHGGGAGHERWLVSYADFITLLFAFFAVLFATSERNVEKTQEFQESIKRYLIKAGSFGESGSAVKQGEKNTEAIESPLPTYKSSRPQDAAVVEATEKQVEEALSGVDRKKYLIDVFSDDLGVRIVVKADEVFAANGIKFLREAMPFVDRIAGMINRLPQRVLIEGHSVSSEDAVLASYDLSNGRAMQLFKYFVRNQKIPVQKLLTMSYGEPKSLSKDNSSLNNRIEFVVLFEDAPL